MISIIIPVYNSEKTIESCVHSVENQLYKDIEIIIVNDGSTDGSESKCQELARTYKNISVITIQNSGVSNARNIGIRVAKGEFLQFVDSDDVIDKKYSYTLWENINKTQADLVICGYKEVVGDEQFEVKCNSCKVYFRDRVFDSLLRTNKLLNNPWNKLYKTDMVKHFFPLSTSLGEDLIFNIEYIRNCKIVSVIDDCLYYYISRKDSLTTSFYREKLQEIIKLDKYFVNNDLGAVYYQNFVSNCYDYFCLLVKDKKMTVKRIMKDVSYMINELQEYNRFENIKVCNNIKHRVFMYLVANNCRIMLWLIALGLKLK